MKVFIAGASGVLGRRLVRQFVARGHSVIGQVRGAKAESAVREAGGEPRHADLFDAESLARAAEGCDTVFHVAAKAGVWGPYADYYSANVLGTRNVLAVCTAAGVRRLIHTSSPSVVHAGGNLAGANESLPYPKRFETHYPRTKAEAEQSVLSANGPLLSTVALRPHLIWGPGDNHLFPRLIQRAKQNKIRRVGKGENIVDTTFIDNAADAHLLVADALDIGSAVAGKVYFISNGEPLPLWGLIDRLLACGAVPPVRNSVSATTAYAVGSLLELIYKLTGRLDEPPMTRFVARQLSTSHWYCLDAARRDFGYEAHVSVEEGLKRLAESIATADQIRPRRDM